METKMETKMKLEALEAQLAAMKTLVAGSKMDTRSLDVDADHKTALDTNKDFNYRSCTATELKEGFEQGLPIDCSDRSWFGFNAPMTKEEQWDASKYVELSIVGAMVRLYMEMWTDGDDGDDGELFDEYVSKAYPYQFDLHELNDRSMGVADYWFQTYRKGGGTLDLASFLEHPVAVRWLAADVLEMFKDFAGMDQGEILEKVRPESTKPFQEYVTTQLGVE